MMTIITDPRRISVSLCLSELQVNWSDVDYTAADALDKQAIDAIVNLGFAEAKIRVIARRKGHTGSLVALFHVYGPCDAELNELISAWSQNRIDWADSQADLYITKEVVGMRLSSKMLAVGFDRPNVRASLLPELIEQVTSLIDSPSFPSVESPEVELLEANYVGHRGPDEASEGVFYWDGIAHRLTNKNWQLVCVLWAHAEVELQDVGETVWGCDETPETTIRAQLNRLNKELGELNLPLAWRIEDRQIKPEFSL